MRTTVGSTEIRGWVVLVRLVVVLLLDGAYKGRGQDANSLALGPREVAIEMGSHTLHGKR